MLRRGTYFPNLDALRFISFLFIFWGHALDTESEAIKQSEVYEFLKNYIYILGKTGFSFAFVLSSYINTWVILEERETTGSYHPWKFYVRRALRIWPLYFAMLFFCFVIFPFFKINILGESFIDHTPLWPFLTFWGNFYILKNGYPYLPALSVLWSVCVEEQFYLVWPWILLLFHRLRFWLIGLLWIVFFGFTGFYFYKTNVFFHTLFMCGDIGAGALFAFISFRKEKALFAFFQRFSQGAIIFIYIVFINLIVFYHPIFENKLFSEWLNLALERLSLAVMLAFFIFEQNFCKHSFFKFGRLRGISYLGMISYGLFCFHEAGLMLASRLVEVSNLQHHQFGVLLLKPILAFLFIFPFAAVSFKYFEMPFLKLKLKV